MSVTEWVTAACVLALVVVLAIVALDRNRLRQRMNNAEGAVTGLTADLQATRALVEQLQSYLQTRSSWEVDAVSPTALSEQADRWSPTQGSALSGRIDHSVEQKVDHDAEPFADGLATEGISTASDPAARRGTGSPGR